MAIIAGARITERVLDATLERLHDELFSTIVLPSTRGDVRLSGLDDDARLRLTLWLRWRDGEVEA